MVWYNFLILQAPGLPVPLHTHPHPPAALITHPHRRYFPNLLLLLVWLSVVKFLLSVILFYLLSINIMVVKEKQLSCQVEKFVFDRLLAEKGPLEAVQTVR